MYPCAVSFLCVPMRGITGDPIFELWFCVASLATHCSTNCSARFRRRPVLLSKRRRRPIVRPLFGRPPPRTRGPILWLFVGYSPSVRNSGVLPGRRCRRTMTKHGRHELPPKVGAPNVLLVPLSMHATLLNQPPKSCHILSKLASSRPIQFQDNFGRCQSNSLPNSPKSSHCR